PRPPPHLPASRRTHTDQLCPTMAAAPALPMAMSGQASPGHERRRGTSTASAPLARSNAKTAMPAGSPSVLRVLVAPVLPLPYWSRLRPIAMPMSRPPGTAPSRYAPAGSKPSWSQGITRSALLNDGKGPHGERGTAPDRGGRREEAKALRRQLLQAAQVLHDWDADPQQDCVRGAGRVAHG